MKNTNLTALFAIVLWLAVIVVCGTFIWNKINGSWWNAFDLMVTVVAVNILASVIREMWETVKNSVDKM